MPTLIIDGKEISVNPGTTVMEAARKLGVYIPHFCYHPRLSVAGNCRMCMVEIEKVPRPVIACAQPVSDGMVVHTNSPAVAAARKGVMEFLLINHPMDCPVCDQGGECDLQDLSMKYGPDRSRFHDEKRTVHDKDLGPLIETVMNRCIHCTRCIRFSEEIAGVEEMGAVFRGDHMSVGTYVQRTLSSEMAGNLAEVCPVGALNLKPFHFQARSWELKRVKGICTHCSVGCHVRRDHMDGKVKRVMAVSCDDINQSWLCDRGRFAYDGLSVDRLRHPLVKRNKLSPTPVAWQEALDRAAEILKSVKPDEVAGLADADRHGAEELYAFQEFLRTAVGTPHIDHRLRQRDFSGDGAELTRADLLMNTPLANLEQADAIVLIGCDARYEVPLLNLRLRKAAQKGARVFSIHPRRLKSNVPNQVDVVVTPGEETAQLSALVAALKGGAIPAGMDNLVEVLKKAQRPAVILGSYANNHGQAESLRRLAVAMMEAVNGLRGDWNGYNRIPARSNSAAAQDLGVLPHRGPGYRRLEKVGMNAHGILKAAAEGRIKVLFLLGADPVLDAADTVLAKQAMEKVRVIYLGAFRTESANSAEVVLAGVPASEKNGTYTNAEGRVQRSAQAVSPLDDAKEDWRILRALSDRFAAPLPYNTVEALRQAMAQADLRYNLDGLSENELPKPCNHSPVTTGLPVQVQTQASSGNGLKLVVETSFLQDDPTARRSVTLGKLEAKGNAVRIHPADGERHGLSAGKSVRLINGERTVDAVVQLDPHVPEGVVVGFYGASHGAIQDLWPWEGQLPLVSLVSL